MNSKTCTFVVCLAVLSSCDAHYRPTLNRYDPVGSNSRKAVAGDLIFYVEEYGSPQKSQRAFDTDLLHEGILPVLVLVRNNGKGAYRLRTADFALRGAAAARPASAETAAKIAQRDLVRPAVGWGLVVPMYAILPAMVWSGMETNDTNRKLRADFHNKAFIEGTVESGRELSGFLFFEVEKAAERIPPMILGLKATSIETGMAHQIDVPLPEIGPIGARRD